MKLKKSFSLICFFILFIILILFIIFLSSCSLLSTNNNSSGSENYQLRVTIYDNPLDKNPVEGVTVFINDSNEKGLINSIKTGSDGVADFGKIATQRIDLSYAFEETDEYGTYRTIVTFKDVSTGEWDIYLYSETSDEDIPVSNINVQVTDLPESYNYTEVYPMYSSSSSDNAGLHSNIDIYSYDVQTDGNISMIASAFDSSGNSISYGYLLDQPLNYGSTYEISLLYSQNSISFTTNRSIDYLAIDAIRKGVYFELGYKDYSSSPVTSGGVPTFDQFPLSNDSSDFYEVNCYSEQQINTTESRDFDYYAYYESLPSEINLYIPSLQIDYASYDPDIRNVSWSISGDSSFLDFYYIDLTYSDTDWQLFVNPSQSDCKIPELPDEIANWIDLYNSDYSIGGYDLKDVHGIDDFYNKLDNFMNVNLNYATSFYEQSSSKAINRPKVKKKPFDFINKN